MMPPALLGSAPDLHAGNDPPTRLLRVWVVNQAPAARRAEARLKLTVALGALTAAFEEWDAAQPLDAYPSIVSGHLDRLACAFPAT